MGSEPINKISNEKGLFIPSRYDVIDPRWSFKLTDATEELSLNLDISDLVLESFLIELQKI